MALLYHGADVVAWNKLYRRRLFAEVRYPEGRVYEDHGTTSKLVQLAERPWALDIPLYHYRIRRDSIGNTDTGKHVRDRLDMFRTEARWLEENGYPALARERYARVALSYLIRMGLEAEWSPECLRILREEKRPVPDLDRLNAWMLALLRLSPFLFDRVSVLCGMRRWQREGGGEG